jgi:hypothetical protein
MTATAQQGGPNITCRIHNNGRLYNTINNNGTTGNLFDFPDVQTDNRTAPTFYFPRYSRVQHGIYSALWVGGIIGNDTLTSVSIDETYEGWWTPANMEFWPDYYPGGEFTVRSTDVTSPYYDPRALAQYECRTEFTDTFVYQSFIPYSNYDNRFHRPLHLRVTQTSYSWSYKYAEDFIIVDYAMENIGSKTINSAFAGIYYVGAVYHVGELPYPRLDDLEGHLGTYPYETSECGLEKVNIAYICDNDGQPNGPSWNYMSTRNCLGIAPLRVPHGTYLNNFNWWVSFEGTEYNWGPRRAGTPEYPFRSFFDALGMPLSDRNRYYLMSKPEVDYCGYEAAVDHSREGWLPPFEYGSDIADGHYVRFLTSFGPFTLPPGATEHLTVVFAVGENIHTDPAAFRNLYQPDDPYPFESYLNFDDLITNIRWAKRVFDNPGVDTDRDGDSGLYVYHFNEATGESLKVFCEGDGVPDFRGATPPPPPPVRLITEEGRIRVRWNGRATENNHDVFTGIQDFEGYRVYLARSTDERDISLLASYDRADYSRYKWNDRHKAFELTEVPFTLDSLRALYGPSFEPLDYTQANPLSDAGGVYYFTAVDFNQADLSNPTGIHKLYPDAACDTADVDEEGRMRCYEYEYVIESLLPTVPYYVAVTAFDYGFPAKSVESLESAPTENLTRAFAVKSGEEILKDGKLNVYCYPNPYRVDADYTGNGFENRFTDLAADRARSIFFVNVPNRCTISVFSLDGDLVRSFEHDEPEGSATASVARFDLITRNTQALVSGLYYWVVESTLGNQIGKLTVIK